MVLFHPQGEQGPPGPPGPFEVVDPPEELYVKGDQVGGFRSVTANQTVSLFRSFYWSSTVALLWFLSVNPLSVSCGCIVSVGDR